MGLPRDKVKVEVLKKGRSGFLGLGAEDAKVLVKPLPAEPDYDDGGQVAKEVLEQLLRMMRVPCGVELKSFLAEDTESKISPITLDVRGNDLGLLIGRRGQTLASLQHIVRIIVAHRLKARTNLIIDVEGYKVRHYESLRTLAIRLAQTVESSGRSIALEPMPADERRVVHVVLADYAGVKTQSIGDGDIRKVVIVPQS